MELVLAVILLAPAIAIGAIWGVAIARMAEADRVIPTLASAVPLAEADPIRERICVIVPAHNEEASIGAALRSLRAQRGVDLRVVLALDRCTDATRERAAQEIAGDERFEVIQIDHCPEGWPGKVHAIWRAVAESPSATDADLLLFLDADVAMHPDCVRAAAALRRRGELDIVTLLPTLRHRHWFERLVQPACVIELAYEFPLARANRRQARRTFVNGQFVLFTRAAYERLGGHRVLRDEIMEDYGMARLSAERGLSVGVFPAEHMLTVSMHETWDSFRKGWTRIFVAGSAQRVRRMERWAMRIWFIAAGLPALTAIILVAAALGVAADGLGVTSPLARGVVIVGSTIGLLIHQWAILALYRRQRAPLWSSLLFVPAAWTVGTIMWQAARMVAARRPISWGGRMYVFKPR